MDKLIQHLMDIDVLKTPAIIDAFKNIDRKKFVPEEMQPFAYIDEALNIGKGQTISQPYTVAFMLELLEPKPGEKILDIGAGSGWQTCLLAHIVGEKGKVFAMEIVPELCKFGKTNIKKFDFIDKEIVVWICGDASQQGTFEPVKKEIADGVDKIIAAASLAESRRAAPIDEVPRLWKDMLKIGGRIAVPVKNSIWLFTKKDGNEFEKKEYPGFAFVPFVVSE